MNKTFKKVTFGPVFALLVISSLYFWLVVWSFYKELDVPTDSGTRVQVQTGPTGFSGDWKKGQNRPQIEWIKLSKPTTDNESTKKEVPYKSAFSGNWRKGPKLRPKSGKEDIKVPQNFGSNYAGAISTGNVDETQRSIGYETEINVDHETHIEIAVEGAAETGVTSEP